MVRLKIKQFVHGFIVMIPAIALGLAIARYVPSRVIGFASCALLVFVIYIAGFVFEDWWRKL